MVVNDRREELGIVVDLLEGRLLQLPFLEHPQERDRAIDGIAQESEGYGANAEELDRHIRKVPRVDADLRSSLRGKREEMCELQVLEDVAFREVEIVIGIHRFGREVLPEVVEKRHSTRPHQVHEEERSVVCIAQPFRAAPGRRRPRHLSSCGLSVRARRRPSRRPGRR
jgi:hypothetical protein